MAKTKKPKPILTRQSITDKISELKADGKQLVLMHYVGRALLYLYNAQTCEEKHYGVCTETDYSGFSKFDVELGTRDALHYRRTNTLSNVSVNYWCKLIKAKSKTDKPPVYYARIGRYHRQLNLAAVAKLANKETKNEA